MHLKCVLMTIAVGTCPTSIKEIYIQMRVKDLKPIFIDSLLVVIIVKEYIIDSNIHLKKKINRHFIFLWLILLNFIKV